MRKNYFLKIFLLVTLLTSFFVSLNFSQAKKKWDIPYS